MGPGLSLWASGTEATSRASLVKWVWLLLAGTEKGVGSFSRAMLTLEGLPLMKRGFNCLSRMCADQDAVAGHWAYWFLVTFQSIRCAPYAHCFALGCYLMLWHLPLPSGTLCSWEAELVSEHLEERGELCTPCPACAALGFLTTSP